MENSLQFLRLNMMDTYFVVNGEVSLCKECDLMLDNSIPLKRNHLSAYHNIFFEDHIEDERNKGVLEDFNLKWKKTNVKESNININKEETKKDFKEVITPGFNTKYIGSFLERSYQKMDLKGANGEFQASLHWTEEVVEEKSSNSILNYCEICKEFIEMKNNPPPSQKKFRLRQHYVGHFRDKLKAEMYKLFTLNTCKVCDKIFPNNTSAIQHIGITHNKLDIILNENGIQIPDASSHRPEDQKSPSRNNLHTCDRDWCGYKSNRSGNWERHMRDMHEKVEEPTLCCNEFFHTRGELTFHTKLLHANGSRYVCLTPDRKACRETIFIRRALLHRHVQAVHMKRKSFVCQMCDYGSSHRSNFERHTKGVHGIVSKMDPFDIEDTPPRKTVKSL